MRKELMTDTEIKLLAKEKRKAYRIGFLFFAVLSITSLVFQYRDLLTGTGSETTRPPVYQLIIGLIAAVAVGYLSYRFFASDYTRDITSAEKKVCERKVVQKYAKKREGHLIRLSNTKELSIDEKLFGEINVGDLVVIHRAPKSEFVFSVQKK